MPRPDKDLEIFTDLHGAPEDGEARDETVLDELDQGKGGKKKTDDEDADLLVDEEIGDEPGDEPGDDEPGDEPGDEDEEAPAAAVEAFDPKDVQIIALRSADLENRENGAKEAAERAKQDLADSEAAMLAAKEAGDSKADVAASKKFAEATVAASDAKATLTNLANEKSVLAREAQQLLARAPRDAEGKPVIDRKVEARAASDGKQPGKAKGSKLIPKFLAQNAWFNDPKYADRAEVLKSLDKALAAEKKLNKDTPEYFAELGRRYNRLYPGQYKTLDGKQVATGQRQRGAGTQVPSGGGGRSSGGGGSETGKVKFTNDDLTQMRKFGMDPDDMSQRRVWLNEKIALNRKTAA